MILCFELSMPYAASWNGKWSGADQGHYIFKTSQAASMQKLFAKLDGGSWAYRWDDGWCAVVSARIVDAKRSCSANTAGMILSSRQCVVIVVCRFSGVLTAIFCINISDRKK